jgi:Holliday junction resolvasome RuvABC endonuclease subunit
LPSNIVLGIDPGFTQTGLAVINGLKLHDYKVLSNKELTTDIGSRCLQFAQKIVTEAGKICPSDVELVVLEKPFLQRYSHLNPKTFAMQNRLLQAIYDIFSRSKKFRKVQLLEVTPTEIKAIIAKPTASKSVISSRIIDLFALDKELRDIKSKQTLETITDAISIAYYGLMYLHHKEL